MNAYKAIKGYTHKLSHSSNEMFASATRTLVVFLALLNHLMLSVEWMTNAQGLVGYTWLLLGYLYFETKYLWTREPHLFWINPVVLASLFTFVMPFGITNVLYFMPTDMIAGLGLKSIVTPWMNQLMLLVVLGAVSMWMGYSSGFGSSMGLVLQRSPMLHRWVKPTFKINKRAIYALLAIGLIAKLGAIKLGIFGYSSSYQQLIAAAAYTQYFTLANDLGTLALVGLALQVFASPTPTRWDRYLLWMVLGYEVAFGFLSGFKSAVGMPFIIVGFVYYSQHHHFPRWLVPAVVVSVIAAYAVIEPFRAARYADKGFVGTDLGSIATTMIQARNVKAYETIGGPSTGLSFLGRNNLTYIGSLGIEYAAKIQLPPDSPDFLGDILLAPAHAFIPRFLWKGKPLGDLGLWYTKRVLGTDILSSTGMSAFTYLNFAGGPLAVILGFVVVGILQRGLFDGFRNFGGGGMIVLFGLLGTLGNIDSAFNTFFISIIRFLPMMIVIQYVLLRNYRSRTETQS